MKKLFTLTFMFVLSCAMSFAQSKFEFVDVNGNVIPNGSVYEASGEFEDYGEEFGSYTKHSGIYIKGEGTVSLSLEVTKDTQGMNLACCAGGLCSFLSKGVVTEKDNIIVKAGENTDIDTHCDYEVGVSGKSEIILALHNGNEVYSKITLVFATHDLAGIDSIVAENALCNIYDITGKLVKANVNKNAVYSMTKGLYIVRELAGAKNVNKVIVK